LDKNHTVSDGLKKAYFGCSPHISQTLGGSTSVKKGKTGHGKIGAREKF